jgi:hypothetical protein
MAHVITFATGMFDISKEEPNPINPIGGQALLHWLGAKLAASGYRAGEPATEDWGWYVDVSGDGGTYLVGASGEPDGPATEIEWTVQIHRHRSFKDKLTGRNRMAPQDPLATLIERLVRGEAGFRDVHVEREP